MLLIFYIDYISTQYDFVIIILKIFCQILSENKHIFMFSKPNIHQSHLYLPHNEKNYFILYLQRPCLVVLRVWGIILREFDILGTIGFGHVTQGQNLSSSYRHVLYYIPAH